MDIKAIALLCDNETDRNQIPEIAMPRTTIRLPEYLRERVAVAAERAGMTTHSFILDAIAQKVDQSERCADFSEIADKRYAHIIASGKTIPWNEMRSYLENRLAGYAVTSPVLRTRDR
jgi:predicted transcriptional regulator